LREMAFHRLHGLADAVHGQRHGEQGGGDEDAVSAARDEHAAEARRRGLADGAAAAQGTGAPDHRRPTSSAGWLEERLENDEVA